MILQREIPALIALSVLGACFKADDANDEIGATETAGTTESTDTNDATTESTSESTTESTSDSDTTTGADPFIFASDPPENYARVDRMGMPAVATALISSKDQYNASSPYDDANMAMFVQEIGQSINTLHDTLDDDIMAAGLTPCSPIMCTFGQTSMFVVPDTLRLNLTMPPGFPNGRRLSDRVIDLTLAVIMLDLQVHPPTTLADLPLNPPANDVVFLPGFPFLAPPH